MPTPQPESAPPAVQPSLPACIKQASVPCTCAAAPSFRTPSNLSPPTFERPATIAPTTQKQTINLKLQKRLGTPAAEKPIGKTQRKKTRPSLQSSTLPAATKAGSPVNPNTKPSPRISHPANDRIHPSSKPCRPTTPTPIVSAKTGREITNSSPPWMPGSVTTLTPSRRPANTKTPSSFTGPTTASASPAPNAGSTIPALAFRSSFASPRSSVAPDKANPERSTTNSLAHSTSATPPSTSPAFPPLP